MKTAFLLFLFLIPAAHAQDPILKLGATPTELRALSQSDPAAYTLPPEKLKQAEILETTFTRLHFAHELWTPLELALILALGLATRMRNLAHRLTQKTWLVGPLFCLQLLLLHAALTLPFQLYGHHVVFAYGLSIQHWPGWFADYAKSLAIFYLLGTLGAMLFLWVVRRSPTRWWLWFSATTAVAILAGAFATPYVYDPLFSTFTPLQQTNPELVAKLESIVARSPGVSIPPDRMFLMRASEKVTTVNAYVTGFGASKRVVVWDTSLRTSTPDDILAIFAHEMGHYVLHHLVLGIALSILLLTVEFYAGFHLTRRLVARTRIPTPYDWAALPLYLCVLALFGLLTEPLTNAGSRWIEHNADVYGQEALHGLLPDPARTTAASFQHLGEQSLDLPDPNPLVEFWTYSHPSISHRAAFAKFYDPWAPGAAPKYLSR